MAFGKKQESDGLPPSDAPAVLGAPAVPLSSPDGAADPVTRQEAFTSGTTPLPALEGPKPGDPLPANDPANITPINTDGVMHHPSPEQKAAEDAQIKAATDAASGGKSQDGKKSSSTEDRLTRIEAILRAQGYNV